MTERHPSAALLASFATGELALPPVVTVSAHLEGCPGCRLRVMAYEEAEGGLLSSVEPTPLDDQALDRTLARLTRPPAIVTDTGPARPRLGDVELPDAAAKAGFHPRRWLRPGLWSALLRAPAVDGWRTLLLRAPAGARIPSHTHAGRELIAVLSGAFADGTRYDQGDFSENLPDSDHELVVGRDAPCACLISMQGPIHWRGWARMITPLLGV